MSRRNVLDCSRADLVEWFGKHGEREFRATQLMQWLYHKLVLDFESMTNVAKTLRVQLDGDFEIALPQVQSVLESKDGTVKWLMTAKSGDLIEAVLIPDRHRQTLCISSQVGCVLDCTFCATGKQGFNGNLGTSEIIGQVIQACLWMREHRPKVNLTNIVFMGMGEPLLNFGATMKSISIMRDDLGFGLSRRRVTISTAGVVPAIYDLCGKTNVALAVSLHAPNNDIRSELVPLNRRYPIERLLDACREYLATQHVKAIITFEYSLIKGVNDSVALAIELAKLLRNFRCKVNLIPFNPFPGTSYQRPNNETVLRFQKTLMDRGVMAIQRTTRGADIAAACGQLVGQVHDKTRRASRYRKGQSSVFVPVDIQPNQTQVS